MIKEGYDFVDWTTAKESPAEEIDALVRGAEPYREWKRSLQLPVQCDIKPEESFALAVTYRRVDTALLLSTRLTAAAWLLNTSVEIDPERRGGVPVLYGTRFPIAQILGELADNSTVSRLARNYSLDAETIRTFLRGLAIHLDRPLV